MHKYRAATLVVAIAFVTMRPESLPTMASAQSSLLPSAAAPQPVPPDGLRITLLGTGGGPLVNLRQFGASTLVEAGIPIGAVGRLFLTHLHSDHVMQIPDLLLAGWVGSTGRRAPLEVWGPDGTRDMMSGLEKAFVFDIHMRRDVDEKIPAAGITVQSHDISEGVVLDEDGVKVTAFLVDHGPVSPAFGYRVDYRGRSVALSGDTRVSDNLVKFATGVDVLIHEAVDPVAQRAASANPAMTERIIDHHTTGEQAGQEFARVKPRLAVYSHAPDSEALIAQTRTHYSGPLQGPEDLLVIDVGDQINVRRVVH